MGNKTYVVEFDGVKVSLRERGQHVIGIVLFVSLAILGLGFGYILWENGALLDGILVSLILILVGHILWTAGRKIK